MNDADEAGDRLANLPPPWPVDPLPFIRASNAERGQSVVVLDDDPTGTQTVHDVPVLSEWSVETFAAEFRRETPLFYVLTNSRALSEDAARQLAHQIGLNLREACRTTGRKATVISRSDSTLRGHYPAEVDALLDALDQRDAARLLVPFFEEGGRLTVDDVHYVLEGTRLVPAAETPFARDPRFAFNHSNLRDWVQEKTGGQVVRSAVHSISLTDLRRGGPDRVAAVLAGVPAGGVCVGNAVSMRDVEVLVAGLIAAENAGHRIIGRTAASFVRARAGLDKRPILDAADLAAPISDADADPGSDAASDAESEGFRIRGVSLSTGGLIVVGSHVPKTTSQLRCLLEEHRESLEPIEAPVAALLDSRRTAWLTDAARRLDEALRRGRDVVLFTSRELITGSDSTDSLEIAAAVSSALVELVRRLAARPRYLVAKGGITSSDVATAGLGMKRAMVLGQILPGVPVWQLGGESRFPGMKYIVFPGNVGGDTALSEAYRKLAPRSAPERTRASHPTIP